MSGHLAAFPALKLISGAPIQRSLGVHAAGGGRPFTAALAGAQGDAPGSVVFTSTNFGDNDRTAYVFAPSGDVYATFGVRSLGGRPEERLAVHTSPSGAMSIVPPQSGVVQNPSDFLRERGHAATMSDLTAAFKGLAAAGGLNHPAAPAAPARNLAGVQDVVGAVRAPEGFPSAVVGDGAPGRIGEDGVPLATSILARSVKEAKHSGEMLNGEKVHLIHVDGHPFRFIKSVMGAFIVLYDRDSYAVYIRDLSGEEEVYKFAGGVYSKLDIVKTEKRGKQHVEYLFTDTGGVSRTYSDGEGGAVVYTVQENTKQTVQEEAAQEEDGEDGEDDEEAEEEMGEYEGEEGLDDKLQLPPGDLRQPMRPMLRRMMIDPDAVAAPSGGMVRLCDLP